MFLSKNKQGKKRPPAPSIFSVTEDEPTYNRAEFQYKLMLKYGDIVKIPGIFNYYAISHPDYVQQILQTNFNNYLKTDINYFKGVTKVLGAGLLSNHDLDLWSQQRRLTQPSLHIQKFPTYASITTQCALQMLKTWKDSAKQNQPFDIINAMLGLSLSIIDMALFSGDFKPYHKEILTFTKLANAYLEKGLFIFPWLPTITNLRFIHARKKFDSIIRKVIDQRKQSRTSKPDDLLTILLDAQTSAEKLSDQQIIDEIKTFLIAGHESTGVALGWTWYCLDKYPTVLAKLQQELTTVLNGRIPTYNDLTNLSYTRMVFEEVMRLYPPVWLVTRKSVAEDQFGEYYLPANATVLISPYVLHRHPKYWENPEAFIPERHLSENTQQRPKYAYLPFGGGPRICIGASFVMVEAILIIATIAQQFALTLAPKQQISFAPQLTLRAKHGLLMQAQQR